MMHQNIMMRQKKDVFPHIYLRVPYVGLTMKIPF